MQWMAQADHPAVCLPLQRREHTMKALEIACEAAAVCGRAPSAIAQHAAEPRAAGVPTMRGKLRVACAGALAVAAAALPAGADEVTLNTGDTAWMLTSTVLVILMTIPGLALFYGGMVRAKNVLSVLMQVFAIFCLVTIIWVLWGYSLAFTDGGGLQSFVGGLSKVGLASITPASLTYAIPEYVFLTFQLTFAAITPALIVGAFAERMKFSAMRIFMAAWVTVVYAPICHMVWSGGWLAGLGALDFAGGTVVHINAGIAGLVACLVLGPRRGYGTVAMPPHNLTFTLIGAALLWVGWFGFNAGSAVAANGSAGLAMINTQVATAAAALGWMLVEWAGKGRPSILGMASGAVAGLVAVTPACGASGPMGAMLIGLVSGVVCYWAVTSLKARLRYDDSLDAFGVHGVGGIVGALGVAITCAPELGGQGFGAGNDGIGAQFVTQAITVAFTLAYSGIATFVVLKVAGLLTGGIRVNEEDESEGLDIASHGERAYS